MSTPLFNRSPSNGNGTAAVLGASLASYTSGTTMADLTTVGDEPVLIEQIAWCAEKFSTNAGMLLLAIVDGSSNRRLIGAYDLAAGSGTLLANGRIDVDFVIAAGFKLVAAHNVQDSGSAYTNVHLVPVGGIVR